MILVTGATGFVGRSLVRQLVEQGYPVRVLIHPSRVSPHLPKGVSVEVTVCGLNDQRGLRAALKDIDIVYHLAGSEWQGNRADLVGVDIEGTRAIVQAAREAGIKRFFYLSHLGVDRSSAYPVLKAKAIAENYIQKSGVDYTIVRSAILYGTQDKYTNAIVSLIKTVPFIFLGPGDGSVMIQPLWVEDLVTCMVWALEKEDTRKQIIEVGGPEYLSFRQVVESIMAVTGARRQWASIPMPVLRILSVTFEQLSSRIPISVFWLDYLTINRTCSLDAIPRKFGLIPARFDHRLGHLKSPPRKTIIDLIKKVIHHEK